jgi:hypothetical protein
MRWLVILLLACVALTVLKLAVIALALALVIVVLWGAFVHPAETLGTLAFFLFARILTTHTAPCLAFLGAIAICLLLRPTPQECHGDEAEDDSI